MKKLIVERKWKDYLASRSRHQAKADARFRVHRKKRGLSAFRRPHHAQFKKLDTVDGPADFSIIENPEETIAFFREMLVIARKKNVFVNLSEMKRMTPDAIVGLLATVSQCEDSGVRVSGNFPNDLFLKAMLNDSGFRHHTQGSSVYRPNPAPRGRIVKREARGEVYNNRFDQYVAAGLIEFAKSKSPGNVAMYGPSYSVFCEAMLNTFNHAAALARPHQLWWASVYFDAVRNRVCFTFIDQGVGIFKSYSMTMRLRMLAIGFLLTRGEVLRRLFQGQIPSSTREPGRGNGIPEMYEHCKAGRIRRFVVIANNAIGNAETDEYRELSNFFPGTLLYWEI